MKERVLIVDSGGARGHAFAWKLAQSPHVGEISILPGNGGTSTCEKTSSAQIDPTDAGAIVSFAKDFQPHLVVVSADDPLACGVTDALKKARFRVFGPTRAAAKIEWSKTYAKQLMQKHGIPTPSFHIFERYLDARKFIEGRDWRSGLVVKKDGLAQGKGVRICETLQEADRALYDFMKNGNGKDESASVLEQRITNGHELSMHAFVNGTNYVRLPFSQDNKHLRDGARGPMTGGMGGYAPVRWADSLAATVAEKQILEPVLRALRDAGHPFQGLLYPGLICPTSGWQALEFNARPGDPEWPMYMTLLKNDLHELLNACVDGTLDQCDLEWLPGYAVCVVLASRGYADTNNKRGIKSGYRIYDVEEAEKLAGITVFHGASSHENGRFYTDGGRVLSVVGHGRTLADARERTYEAVEKIYFKDMHYRQDIGTV